VQEHCLFVIATTVDETRHALEVGQTLTSGGHANLSVVVPIPERLVLSSARAGVRDIPVDDLSHPDAELSECVVRALAERMELHPKITVLNGWSLEQLLGVLPSGATVVICGPMNHFVESPEQRIARELSRRKFDVVFLPYMPPPNDGVWTFQETEMMRHLIC
jgi:hypothetical protein